MAFGIWQVTNMYLCYPGGWVAIDSCLPEVQAPWKEIGSTPWNCVDSQQQEYNRHMLLTELTNQWHVQVEAPPYAAIKGAGWMYYDPALYWRSDAST